MKDAPAPFEEPWPDSELRLVVDAVRSAVEGTSGAMANSLAEAGHRWARTHQSSLLMRSRLDLLEASIDADLHTETEAERAAYHRAWRTVADAATLTALARLEEAALLDPLTGVGNRRALDLELTRVVSGARRTGSELVVAVVDLDGLKRINDSRGHAEGDRTLTSLVGAFADGLRASDTVFRTGGDEFAVVLPGMGLADVDSLMHRLSSGGTPAFTWGAASLTAECQGPTELLDAADIDLYHRRGVEREAVGGAARVGVGEGVGGTVVGLRHPSRSLRTRASRRVSVAVAASLVAIAGTLGAVTPLSPAYHAAIPPQHPSGPTAQAGSHVVPPPATTPGPSTPPSTTATTTPAPAPTPAASTPKIQLADVTSPSPGAGSVGATTTSPPSAGPVSTAAPVTTSPPTPAPTTPAPVATGGSSHKPLPPKAAAAAVAAHAKH